MVKDTLNKIKNLLNLPRSIKTLISISIDLTCCIFSVWFSYYLRLGNLVSFSERGIEALGYALIILFPIFFLFGIYKNIFRYSGLNSLINVSKAISIHGILFGIRIILFFESDSHAPHQLKVLFAIIKFCILLISHKSIIGLFLLKSKFI